MSTTNDHRPTVPARVRTVIYATGLAWGTLATLVTAGAAVWWPEQAPAVLATVGAGSSAIAFLAGATGVAYRPPSTSGAPADG